MSKVGQVFVAHDAAVYHTPNGTPYLKEPGVVLLAQPEVNLAGMIPFLEGFDRELQFIDYADDTPLSAADALVKVAGQLCYMSLGPKRTKNHEAQKYLDHIKDSGHGSVLEHANFTFLFYGIDRSVTHELVRHRAGFAFSQVSQRYVDGKVLRFVERPEFQDGPYQHGRKASMLHRLFEIRIDHAARQYDDVAKSLVEMWPDKLAMMDKRDARKAVNQAARACLPNETEAPIVVTANVRGWRHACEMRANAAADVQIRGLFVKVNRILRAVAPLLFSDYVEETLPDGTLAVSTKWRKV